MQDVVFLLHADRSAGRALSSGHYVCGVPAQVLLMVSAGVFSGFSAVPYSVYSYFDLSLQICCNFNQKKKTKIDYLN